MAESITILGLPSSVWLTGLLGCLSISFLLSRMFSVEMDPREPPLLVPNIPIIGHLLDMIKYQNDIFKYIEDDKTPAAYTLPILGNKLYVLKSPEMVQAMFRNTDLTFDQHFNSAMGFITGIPDQRRGEVMPTAVRDEYVRSFTSLMAQDKLYQMNMVALGATSQELARLPRDNPLRVADFNLWLRDLLVLVTSVGLFGRKNPFVGNRELDEGFWWVFYDIPST
jgi:hypothetical protein